MIRIVPTSSPVNSGFSVRSVPAVAGIHADREPAAGDRRGGREAEALVHMRTYQEEVAEALEATGVADAAGAKDKP